MKKGGVTSSPLLLAARKCPISCTRSINNRGTEKVQPLRKASNMDWPGLAAYSEPAKVAVNMVRTKRAILR